MKKSFNLIWIPALSVMLFGCQTVPYQGQAHDVKLKPKDSGVISIPVDPRPEDRAKAEDKMKSNCAPYPVKVLEEGEAVVGAETKSSERESDRASSKKKVGSLFGMPLITGDEAGHDTNSSSVTKNLKEWYITYACENKATAKAGR